MYQIVEVTSSLLELTRLWLAERVLACIIAKSSAKIARMFARPQIEALDVTIHLSALCHLHIGARCTLCVIHMRLLEIATEWRLTFESKTLKPCDLNFVQLASEDLEWVNTKQMAKPWTAMLKDGKLMMKSTL